MNVQTERASQKFLAGFNCAQAVLHAFAPELGLDSDTALKLAGGFGGGMARQGEVCGAVTGGIMAIGLKFGCGSKDDRAATERTYRNTQALMERFAQRHGSCLCRELLPGCDLRTLEGQQRFKELDLRHRTCLSCVQTVAEALADILSEPVPACPAQS
ncbi:MAG: C-GCAxxG-C-C family protein [Verrucomicrobiota bacterium]|jgi:C_GCAxxG_C_C family probable redox protein